MEKYVINCAGEKVPVSGKLFENRCSVGNLEDFIEANKQHIVTNILNLNVVPKIFIVMPIYHSGDNFLKSLKSICSQKWSDPTNVEIMLYINEPIGEKQSPTKRSIDCAKNFIQQHKGNDSYPTINYTYEQLSSGLAEVYQRGFVSIVARIQKIILQKEFADKKEKEQAIDEKLNNTIFSIVDDDLIFPDSNSLSSALETTKAGESITTGEIEITEVKTAYPQWDKLLVEIMNLYFKFKNEQGTATLTPRGIAIKDLFHQPPVKIGADYADQIWFASGASDKKRNIVKALTTLEDEEYPSNAKMTACLSRFLETGEDDNCLAIFSAIRDYYETSCSCKSYIYNINDIDKLLNALKTRNHTEIGKLLSEMLSLG